MVAEDTKNERNFAASLGWGSYSEQQRAIVERRRVAKEVLGMFKGVPNTCLIYGSTSREAIRPDSDLDLLVVVPDFGKIPKISGNFIPEISQEEIDALPSEITNISWGFSHGGLSIHLEIYRADWLRKLLTPDFIGEHRSAVFDPGEKKWKREVGRITTLKGEIVYFSRNQQRQGKFLIFDDFEPGKNNEDVVLRIEQGKVAFCEIMNDELGLGETIAGVRAYIQSSARSILGHVPSLEELTHAFTREEGGHILHMPFSPLTSATGENFFGIGRVEGGERLPPLPEGLRISVTDLCNLRCRYCNDEGMHSPSGKTMGYNSFSNLARLWKEAGGKRVKFTGGEPFLNPHLSEFVAFAGDLDLEPSITTNGHFLTRGNLDWVGEYGVELVVSLDFLEEGARSKLSPVGEKSLAIAERIVEAKRRGIAISVNAVLNGFTEKGILNFMVPWAMSHFIPLRVLEEAEVLPGRTSHSEESLDDFSRKVGLGYNLQIAPRGFYGDIVALQGGKPAVFFLRSFCARGDANSCADNSLRIDPLGQAMPCMKSPLRVPINNKDDFRQAFALQRTCYG